MKKKQQRPVEVGDVILSYIHAGDDPARLLHRSLLITGKTEAGHFIAMNITSEKPNKDYGRIYGNTFVSAEESGLEMDSYIKIEAEYLIPEKNAKLLEDVHMPPSVLQRMSDVIRMIREEGGEIPTIDCTDITRRAFEFQEEQDMIVGLCESFQRDPEILQDYVKFSARFYRYSARNQMLIYQQAPFATFVASFTRWKKLGYSVRKMKPDDPRIFILCRMERRYFEQEDGTLLPIKYATQEEKELIYRGKLPVHVKEYYRRMQVFDISQTTCPPKDYPRFFDPGYSSLTHQELYQCIERCAKASGFSVETADLHSIALDGVCIPSERKIMISDRLEDSEKLAALCHEYAHGLLHIADANYPKAVQEFEAEALSAMICNRFGLPVSERDQDYLANYYHMAANCLEQDLSGAFSRLQKAYLHVDTIMQEYIKETPALLERYQARFQEQDRQRQMPEPEQDRKKWHGKKREES